ncbi:hypothetical protein FHX77_000094 [Bifidobacterium commune]|uniref:Glycosyltransferase n=1 Tax=Bifidobacterium commune TaxID=1505727 RepID=A0A1C4H152_9BIFI|nr:hypothetical protein [Bifidobacterium commune]MBB2954714.1 hypothetical protein [Bifidobacterium commune]SCC78617.1 hypothetical protein GA0061077_0345 [Bifidobacterium commune]
MNTFEHSFFYRHKTAISVLLTGVVIFLLECVVFNLPFWTTLGASRDSSNALNDLGPGLEREADGTLTVTDPTSAFLLTRSDGSSPYIRIDPTETTFRFSSPAQVLDPKHDPQRDTPIRNASQSALETFHVRVDTPVKTSPVRSVSAAVSDSLYLSISNPSDAPQSTPIKVWIQEPIGTRVDIAAVHANVHVPFHADLGRVAAMIGIVVLLALWLPSSRLWRMRLDTANIRQRLAFGTFMAVMGAITTLSIVRSLLSANSSTFHDPGNYTYDFNQYGHLADSLLHGRLSIDLPVPQALNDTPNPYDPQVREKLLDQGVTPIYWDYSFYHGHWYSYFGVLPALLLFAPYRLITSLFVPGGLMLPTGVAVALLLFIFVLFGSLLVIRILATHNPQTSLAATSMAITLFLLGSQAGYLAFRINFYSVPFAASLALSVLGLWFWLGAAQKLTSAGNTSPSMLPHRRRSAQTSVKPQKRNGFIHPHVIAFGDCAPVSVPHLAAGSLCLAANFGCRPPFTLTALLGFAIFWPQIRQILRAQSHTIFQSATMIPSTTKQGVSISTQVGAKDSARPRRTKSSVQATNRLGPTGAAICAILLPALTVVIPLCLYNMARFGSPINFGDRYQITVTNLTHYRNAGENLLPTLVYYLFLRPYGSQTFPFLSINPTPLPSWSYTEPLVAGLFVLCPPLLLIVLLLIPCIRRRLRQSGLLRIVLSLPVLALLLLLIDSVRGGLGWRYMIDFGWLFALAAVAVMVALLPDAQDGKRDANIQALRHIDNALKGATDPVHQTRRRGQIRLLFFVHDASPHTRLRHIGWKSTFVRIVMLLLMLASIVMAFLTIFVPGREDALIRTDPALFQEVASWFRIW